MKFKVVEGERAGAVAEVAIMASGRGWQRVQRMLLDERARIGAVLVDARPVVVDVVQIAVERGRAQLISDLLQAVEEMVKGDGK